jgi:cell division protein ZipA
MGEVELRLLILAVGVIILILIGWGSRPRPKERLEPRADNPRSPENEPHLDTELGRITPDHHLADKVLVDVEIGPVRRSGPAGGEAAAAVEKPEPAFGRREIFPDRYRKAGVTVQEVELEPPPLQESRQGMEAAPAAMAPPPEQPVEPMPPPQGEPSRLTLLLTVMAPPGRPFRGPSILMAAQELKLKLHKSGVFDYFPTGEIRDKPVFGVAHLWEPGTFELDTIGTLSTPGLLMFLNLPGSMAPVQAVDRMIQVARQLAQKLGGTVCNQQRERMTTQAFMKMRNAAAEFEQQLGLR